MLAEEAELLNKAFLCLELPRLAEARLVERRAHRRKWVAPTRATAGETRARRVVVIRAEAARVFRAISARVEDAEPHDLARTRSAPREIPRC